MTHMVITIDVPDVIDPSRSDPHEIAEDMVDEYNDALVINGNHDEQVSFVGAEWEWAP